MAGIPIDQLAISTSIPFELDLTAPPAELADLVNTYFVLRSDSEELQEMMPAYSAQVMVYAKGSARLMPEDGAVYHSDLVTCTAPLMSAVPVRISGPALIAGVSLTPLGWQCLADLPADRVNDCMVPPGDVLSDQDKAALEALASPCAAGDVQPQEVFDVFSAILTRDRCALNPDHVRFVKHVTDWLSSELTPSIDNLYDRVSFSSRTAQRLTKRFFGVSPSRLIKRYRAIRAAMLLTNPALPQAMRDEIRDGYFDQAHLIRDIRRYTGRTPTRLKDSAMLQETLDPEAHGQGARLLRPSGE